MAQSLKERNDRWPASLPQAHSDSSPLDRKIDGGTSGHHAQLVRRDGVLIYGTGIRIHCKWLKANHMTSSNIRYRTTFGIVFGGTGPSEQVDGPKKLKPLTMEQAEGACSLLWRSGRRKIAQGESLCLA
jgi:hypothetical protein